MLNISSFLRKRKTLPQHETAEDQFNRELTGVFTKVTVEESLNSFAEHLPTLRNLAHEKVLVLSAEVDDERGSVQVVFEEGTYTFAVEDIYQANCLAAACRLGETIFVGVSTPSMMQGATLLIAADPWSVYLNVKSVTAAAHV